MGESRMTGWRLGDDDPQPEYSPFFTPPHNEAKVLGIAQPVGHIDSPTLRLRGYSIHSVNDVPDVIDAGYFPAAWAELADPRSAMVRTGFPIVDLSEEGVERQSRRQLLSQAWDHLCNTHRSWRNGSGERRQESAELRRALQDAPEFTTTIEFENAPRRVQAIEHLGDRFARLALPEQSVILTIAGQPATFEESFTLRLPRPE